MPKEYIYDGPTVDLSGVRRSFGFATDDIQGVPTVTGPNVGIPHITQQYRSFSGADYHITAVIPYENDYQARQSPEVARLRKELDILTSQIIPGLPSSTTSELLQRKTSLEQALEIAERDAQGATAFYKTFAELQTLSITSRRSVHPVRRLGEKDATYHTRGPRTWAGSMVFIMLDGDTLLELYRRTHYDLQSNEPFYAPDRIPPFNVLITGINEYGHMVEGILYGVTIVATGQVLSIDDLYTEQQVTYVARHFSPIGRVDIKKRISIDINDPKAGRGFGAASDIGNSDRQIVDSVRGLNWVARPKPRPRVSRFYSLAWPQGPRQAAGPGWVPGFPLQ